jgi:hypothetical protein
MNGIVLNRTCGARWHIKEPLVSFSSRRISLQALHSRISWKIMLFRSWTTTILFFKWNVHLFIWSHFTVTELEFPRSLDRKRRTSCVAPSFSWSDAFGRFPVGGYEKDQVYSQRVNRWSQGTYCCSNCKRYKGCVTARLARGGLCRWDVCRAAGSRCEVFRITLVR